MKKIIVILVTLAMLFTAVACREKKTQPPPVVTAPPEDIVEETGDLIGVALPTKSSQRWIQDGNYMRKQFEEKGYRVDLQYGENNNILQIEQLRKMIADGAKVLVICAIDGQALRGVLEEAAEADIKIIAYDRLLLSGKNVDYYTTFDNFKAGALQGEYIVEALGLKSGNGTFNIELFGGAPDDSTAAFFYDGAMSVLKQYIDSGRLVVRSGQMSMNTVYTLSWDAAAAQKRMEVILSENYTAARVDAILCPYDGMSLGIITALKNAGYGSEDKKMPIVTGQDAEIDSIKSIIAGEQTMTIFKDTRILAEKTVGMVDAILKGEEPEVNDVTSYNNGVKTVPAYRCQPVTVDISNYYTVLVESGYYKESLFPKPQ